MMIMRVNIVEKDVMDPIAEAVSPRVEITPIPKIINKISYFNNTKPGASVILDIIQKNLNKDYIEVKKPAGAPASEEQIKKVEEGDLVILALGDCGSCSTWIILDSIRLEKEKIPTICICTHKFSDYSHSLAKAQGAENLRIVEISHPIAGLKKNEVRLKTEKIIPKIKDVLKIN